MPAAMPETRKLVESLYLQGVATKIIAKRTGVSPNTIAKWSQRHGWTKARDTANGLCQKSYAEAQSSRVKTLVGNHVEMLANATTKLSKPRGVQAIREQAEMLNALVTPAAKTFGWVSEGQQSVTFQSYTLNASIRDTIRPAQGQASLEDHAAAQASDAADNQDPTTIDVDAESSASDDD